MDEANRRVLTKKRAILKASVTRIQHFVDYEVTSADNGLIHVKLNRLLSANEEFRQIQSEIELHDDENEEANAAYRVEFEDTVDVLEAKLRKASNVQTTHGSDEVLTQSSNGMSKNIKLPKINRPAFSGTLTTWLHFKDTFEGLVVNNNDLSNIEKFHYLLSSLNGEAKDSIRNISISDTNFQVAYNILVNRYHSPKLIAAEYIRQIMETSNKLGSTESEIRHLIDTFKGSIDALNALNAQPSILDLLLNELLLSRLDKKLRLEFEKEHANLDAVGFKELINFLERRCQTLQLCSSTLATSLNNHPKPRSRMTPQQQSYISTAERCYICSEEHRLYKCPDFLKLSSDEKYKLIKDSKHCTNCLSPSHTWKACNSNTACKLCKKYHHTLLHQEDQKRATSNPRQARDTMAQSPQNNNTHQSSYHSLRSTPNTQVLLSTVTVKIKDLNGRYHHLRAVLDSGSQSNFISEQAVQQLKLKKKRTTAISLQAFGELTSQADSSVNIEVHSTISDFHFNMECIVLPRITGNIPASYIDYKEWNIPKDVILADPDFHLPQSTHLLIGAQFFLHLMKEGKRTRKGYPTLQDTHLGWILSGVYPQQFNNGQGPKSLFIRSDLSLEKQLQRFWALEEVSHVTHSPEHMECEKHFSDTTVRDESGRFMVELPMKKEGNLGNSKEIARQRFHFLERKLRLQSDLRRDYVEFMREYEALGHMVELQPNSTWRQPEYYIPHHAVHKHSSSTTKTRVVFDASARTDNGVALNDILMVGPTVQDDLCSLVMQFRMHKIAFTADVEKMYRQVRVHPKHQPLQCILWREGPQDELKSYALTTVTYGTSAAAYLATRCLVQLATDEGTRFPRAASVLRHDIYVDDCISGADTLDEALRLRVELQDLLQLGGFPLRKWCTNSPELLESIPENLREHKHSLTYSESSIVKTLGLTWHPSTDQFQINCGLNSQHSKSKEPSCSKRMVLSIISSIFDPLGLITPVVVLFKVFMQRLWQEGSGWDDQLLGNLLDTWNDLHQQLPLLNHFKIPRLVLIEGIVKSIEIHGFCDASQTAYGASVYIRSVNNKGEVLTKLLCAKSRVAPLKQISIPRLELCGAITLVRLIKKTLGTLRAIPDSVQLWTDSTIVLAWLRACPTKWKTFVANRVAEIQDVAPASHWRHVKSQDNPADIASRGVQPLLLQDCALWWEGPSWLRLDPSSWPSQVRCDTSKIPDQRIVTSLIVMQHDDAFLDHFSSLNRLLRTVSHCLRFSSNCKKSRSERDTSPLKPQEINNAFNICLNIVQSVSYQREIQCLKQGKTVDATSKLKSLSPIMDQDGYLRVGGRLQNAPVSYEAKHQLILPPEHHFTKLVILSEHVRLLHAGPQLLISSLRQRYWVPRIRQVVKKCTHSCYTCFRLRTATAQQKMANLPRFRVTPSRAFMNVGVDYAGPFLIRMGTQRSKTTGKAYVGIFTCLATRAVHMEVISDLTTSAFMAALRRFTSRRGCPSNIYSDNGTNFIGASREMKELQEFLRDEKEERDIVEVAGGIGITWHFIPPSAPHFGGVWESMVKAFKHHLRRTMGTTILTFEELTTLSSQIEACLNSRPLSRLSDDPTDSSLLTPAHFLIDLQCLISSQVSYTLQAFWGVSIRELHLFLWRPWSVLQSQVEQGALLRGHYQQRGSVLQKSVHSDEVVTLFLPKPALDLGTPPRMCYPLVIFLIRNDSHTMHPDETVALINVVHIKDSVCTLPTSILAQYLKQANGQLSCLKQLYLATGNPLGYEEEPALVCSPEESEGPAGSVWTTAGEQLCVVCQYFPLSRALLPCRHTCICASCFGKLDRCPMCRSPIRSYFCIRGEDYMPVEPGTPASKPPPVLQWLQDLNDRLTDFLGFQR